jgi:GNAT superfamily N-acetyltransferase
VTDPTTEFRPTLDPAWLETVAAQDPVAHAYAVWDLQHHPDRIRLVSAVVGGRTLGYLLIWLGHPAAPVVHWVGTEEGLGALADQLPPRPLVAIVPDGYRRTVEAARGPVVDVPLLSLLATEATAATEEPGVRRLVRSDRPSLAAWAARQEDPLVAEYPHLDPDAEMLWGAFDGNRLVGVVRAAVRLPRLWILGGVYVEPPARSSGRGRALVATALATAIAHGARLALYVREDRAPARALYASLGFQLVDRRSWLDCGSGLVP